PVTRILIADDHEVVRFGLRAILEAHEGWEVVAEACDGKEAIAKAVETSPDVAIIDYSLPTINGVEATRQIRARVPTAEVLIFTMHDSEVLVGELLEAGARAYLLKSDAKQYLTTAVESLASHKPFFTGKVSAQLLDTFLAKEHGKLGAALSPRERVIVQLIAVSQQQGNDSDPQSQRQDDRNAPRGGDAQAQRHFDRCNRPLCHPQQAGGALEARRLRLPCGGTHSDTGGAPSVTGSASTLRQQ